MAGCRVLRWVFGAAVVFAVSFAVGCGQGVAEHKAPAAAPGGAEQAMLTGNPVTDAGNAVKAGDFRFKAIRDEHGAMVVPGVSKLAVEGYGYPYSYAMIYSAAKGFTPSQRISLLDKIYFYAASYNTTVLNYMKDHSRAQ